MKYLILNDIPTPWREPVFERVYERLGGAVEVVYFKDNERRRMWTFPQGRHPRTILKAITLTRGEKERFFNPGLVPYLLRTRPRVAVVFTSFKDPSGWLSLLTLRLLGTRIALLDDTWIGRDRDLGLLRWLVRKLAYNCFGDAFVGASERTLEMFRHYNRRIRESQCFLSHLAADNAYFAQQLKAEAEVRPYDVMFSGRIVPVKNPVFFAQVCAGIRARLGHCRALIIGSGDESLTAQMKEVLRAGGVSAKFAGFIPHAQLPRYYAQARLLLLPTSADCWGVVINEAMLAGAPVITTEQTAAAGELVLHERNGCVLRLDPEAWIASACDLLSNSSKWESFSQCARATVERFDYDRAAAGILDAIAYLENPAHSHESFRREEECRPSL